VLRVSNEGLQVLAAHCDAVSAGLVAATPLPSLGLPVQATSGAVGSAYAALDEVNTTLASGPDGHLGEFPGMTKDQLADLVHDMFTRDPKGLIIGRTADGAPVLYDPKINVVVIRDPNGLDCGTVFKPKNGIQYVLGNGVKKPKIVVREPSIPPGQLSDGPLPAPRPAPAESAPPAAPRPPVQAQPAPKPALPSIKEGPMLPGGAGTPIGPTLAPPPHWHGPHVLGDAAEEPWEDDHH
jgi:hypothetical protein